MADYPSAINSPRAKENRSGVVYDPDKKTVFFVEDIQNNDDEIVAIETELATLPKGSYSSVKDRLEKNEDRCISFIIDGGGSAITTGQKGHLEIPFKCEIQRMTILANQSGSIVVDIWKDTYANFPPTDADSITSATPPTIAAGTKAQDSTLTSWTKAIAAGDILSFNVDSVTDIQRVVISLYIKRVA